MVHNRIPDFLSGMQPSACRKIIQAKANTMDIADKLLHEKIPSDGISMDTER
jgi:hypothetical protein